MSVKNIRALLAADPQAGAGNVLASRMSYGVGVDVPLVSFDTVVDGRRAREPFTVAELDQAVRARAAALRDLGLRPRDPVAVYVSNAADAVLSFFALARLGAIPALVNPNLDAERAALFISRLNAVGLLTDQAHRDRLTGTDFGAPLLPDVAELRSADLDAAPSQYSHSPDDPVAITHSSGTTGMPKAVVHSHASLYAAIRYRLSLPRPQGSERMLSALPSAHAATLIAINLALSAQAEILLLSKQTGGDVLDAIESWRPGSVFGFAATWADLARHDLTARDLESVALWWNTGDCAHEAHIRKLIAVGSRQAATLGGRVRTPGSVFVDGLGSTEMGHSHFFITHTQETSHYGRCVGKPHAFVDCEVLDPEGRVLGPFEIGELGTKSPTLALGYWNDSATTYRTRVRGYFLTGDLMYRDDEGYYYHMDRLVDSVDLGDGKRLYTAMAEERILAACPDILDCTVVAVHDGGKAVTDVLVQLRAGADRDRDYAKDVSAALEEHVLATLRDVVVVDEDAIPLGPTGKVRKVVLRQRHLEERGAR